MKLEDALARDKASLLDQWLRQVLASYPADAARFFKREKNRFANPVGQTLATELGAILDGLLARKQPLELGESLERIIKIRSIQELSPSEAVGCISALKQVVRAWAAQEQSRRAGEELRELEDRIDDLVLLSFDIYVQCRERLYELRVQEVKRNVSTIVKRLNAIDARAGGSDPQHPEDANDRA